MFIFVDMTWYAVSTADSFYIFYYIFLLFFIAYNFVCLCVHLYTVQKLLGMHDNLRVYVGGRQSEICSNWIPINKACV